MIQLGHLHYYVHKIRDLLLAYQNTHLGNIFCGQKYQHFFMQSIPQVSFKDTISTYNL